MNQTNIPQQPAVPTPAPRIEEFLSAVESKTKDAVHLRLLQACRSAEPATALDAELNKMIDEIFNETPKA
jgi:hypothetical protein